MESPRTYGVAPFQVAVIHGGPGAPGSMAPVARELARDRGVLEPLQAADSLQGQVEELRGVLEQYARTPVTLIGASWGAMLSFICAAHRPTLVAKLILVGSGVFEAHYAASITPTRLSRLTAAERAEAEAIMRTLDDPAHNNMDAHLARLGALLDRTDAYDPIALPSEALEVDYHIHRRVWADAEQLRSSGALLALGKRIWCPVVAIHGDYDPHPAAGVRDPLTSVLSDFRFILLDRCGHEPWLERQARDAFYAILRRELT